MKIIKFGLISLTTLFSVQLATAQIKVDVKDKLEKKTNQEANDKVNSGIDKSFDNLEKGIGNLFKKKNKTKSNSNTQTNSNTQEQEKSDNQQKEQKNQNNESTEKEQEIIKPQIDWNKYDFVPGDEIIFIDKPADNEENGEFPSKWDLKSGNVEIATVDGQNVIYFFENSKIVPYLKNSTEDYLPEVFTLEFDAFFSPKYSGRYWIYFYDGKNQKSTGNYKSITIYVNQLSFDKSMMIYPGKKKGNWDAEGGWRHISIAFTKGKLKGYIDDTRLLNIPHYEGNPTGITIQGERYATSDYNKYIKNIRLAKGGVKYYDRLMQDGKIVTNGIKFDVNKASLKPESMGVFNKIYKLMQKQADLKFSVEGHTDSDGGESANQTLSEKRAKAVVDKLVSMGIASSRFTSKGWGESKPISDNNSDEGKAKNRRVEFIKIN